MTAARRFIVALAVMVVLAGAAWAPARAQSSATMTELTLDSNTGDLVPGAATVPSFHMNFLLDDASRLNGVPLGMTHDLEISLTSPNSPVFNFLFSPSPQFGIGYDPIAGASRAYVGLTWRLFTENAIYGRFGLAGSFDPPVRANLGGPPLAPLMLHGAVEFGYRVDTTNSLSLAIDQGFAPQDHGTGPLPVDNFLLRFGGKF
jgi:hypothetical protein